MVCGRFRFGRVAMPDFSSTACNALDPDDWKPMKAVGPGVREIRVRDASGAYRVIYVATFAEAVYVLHTFEKKTQRTSPRDLALAQARFKELKHGAAR